MENFRTTEVLIVGAGPTGLMMACQLAIRNIPFRIIDKNENHTTQSRALVMQARSIEILNQMGIAHKAVSEGQIAKAIGAFFNGKKLLRVEVNDMGNGLTKYPYLLMLEQSKTEMLLVEFLNRLGHQVERRTVLLDITLNENKNIARLKLSNGIEEIIQPGYIIGADGAHSIVREQLQIPFAGKTYHQSLFVLDCMAEVDIPTDEMYLTFSDETVGGFFPLTNGRWRVLGTLPKELEGKKEITFEEIEKGFAERVRMDVRLFDPQWISAYRSHHRYASMFQKNKCFLIGDAAHIHSPVGAQGMNTGLQDAYNLAWKLVLVIQGKAKEPLLDTYTAERITIAKTLVRTTDRAFNLVTNPHPVARLFRLYFVPIVMKLVLPLFKNIKLLRQIAFKTISEIGIHYQKSPLSKNASYGSFPRQAPKPGDRLPYLTYEDEFGIKINIQEKVHSSFFHLFLFTKEVSLPDVNTFIQPFNEIISVETIPYTSQTKDIYIKLGIKNSGYYLIRPDLYIACRSSQLSRTHLQNYLMPFFIN